MKFPERLLREPLVDYDNRPLAWWAELVAFPLSLLVVLAFFVLEATGRRPGQ